MQASIARNTSWLRSVATGGCTLLAVFALAVILTGVAGCPSTTPPPTPGCDANSDCDDGRFCNGSETCDIDSNGDGTCVDGEIPCSAEACVESADFCPECEDDSDCDDGLFCNGEESCVAPAAGEVGRQCQDGESPCDAGEDCNEATDTCAPPPPACEDDGDCDDGLFCNGDETCDADGDCQDGGDPCAADETCVEATDFCSAPCDVDADCDDGDFCNGEETCGTNGNCEAGDDPCEPGDDCDEDNDECVGPAVECNSNGDCDDDDPCNGDEVCAIGTNGQGVCEDGELPCDPVTEICDLDDDGDAICLPAPIPTVNFTLNQDNLVGAAGNDTFSAQLALTGLGVQAPTLQNGDVGTGLAGTDTLNATFNNTTAGAVTLSPTLSGIEIFNLSDFGGANPTTFSAINVTGVTAINSVGSLANLTVTNLNTLTNLGLTNSDFDLNVTSIAPAGSGNADAVTLTLSGARDTDQATAQGASVIINTPGNGIETLNVVSSGGAENILEALTNAGGTTLTTLNVSGSAALTIRRNAPLPGTLTTINAGSATGATDLSVGGALNVTYTGGTGNDIINFAGSYTTADIINGGGGTDALGLNAAQAVTGVAQANVTGIETLLIVNTLLGETIDVTRFGATDAILDTTGAALLLNLPSNITLAAGNRFITFNNDDINDQLNVTVSGVSTSDVLTANFFNADHTFGGTTVTLIGAETVNLVSGNGLDGTAADGNANTAVGLVLTPTTGTGTLNISGAVSFNVTGGITAGTINASAAGAAFIHETTTGIVNAASATITGSAFNDELVGGNGNDGISGLDGNDFIKGGVGADIATGAGGTDHFFFDAVGQFGDTIADMTAGSDNVGLGSGIINFAGVAGTENAPVELTAANFETGRATISAIAAGDTLKIVRISGEQTTAQITADTGALVAAYALVFDSTLQRGVLYHDADWSSAAGRTLVARFENLTTNAQVQALTFTDFEEID